MPPINSRRRTVTSGTTEQATENKDTPLRRSSRKRTLEQFEADVEDIMSEALSDGPRSSNHPAVLSSASNNTNVTNDVSQSDGAEEDAVEAVRLFDQDEEYARQLQEEEYAAIGAVRDRFSEIARRVFQLGANRPNEAREMARIHRELIPNLGVQINLSGEENEEDSSSNSEQEFDFAHELDSEWGSEGHVRRPESESEEDGDHYYEEGYGEDGGTDYDDYDDYEGVDNAEIIRLYRQVAHNEGPLFVHPFVRLVDFLEQARHGQRVMNAVGPFIADEDFDSSYEALINLSERIGEVAKKGMLAEHIAKLKTVQWTDKSAEETPVDSRNCPICLELYQVDDKLMALRCTHRFHWDCAKRWLTDRATCPICRISTRDDTT